MHSLAGQYSQTIEEDSRHMGVYALKYGLLARGVLAHWPPQHPPTAPTFIQPTVLLQHRVTSLLLVEMSWLPSLRGFHLNAGEKPELTHGWCD